MNKRFQVFISSTYADLKDERQAVIQAVIEMDCIPAGMELFPAADEEQWKFIRRVIDDCDYYIVIIGGRYGTLTDEDISYTEKEYDYAISIGLKVLAFVHERPKDIPIGKSDVDFNLRQKLDAFRNKVTKGRLVKMWNSVNQLPGLVTVSLSKTIKDYPAVGWVRSANLGSNELTKNLSELRNENIQLKESLAKLEQYNSLDNDCLASLDDSFSVLLKWTEYRYQSRRRRSQKFLFCWKEIFACIAPDLQMHPSDGAVQKKLGNSLYRKKHPTSEKIIQLDDDDFQTIRLQFTALGLISTRYSKTTKGGMALFWTLTKKGQQTMMQLRTVKAVVRNDT